ncbi:mannose-6-phosphate isomerase, class I [Anaerosporobacter faecicola]|uniref:mannose-6-phosphate isomerase, class I n=1 Tax=Anaerosporobacter faecicola TaxID=2718714 RepID=UPI001439ED8D|nr:mannose-6-phosphate isomerase, class I [Anaerosporobacter faecicola]
MKQTEQILFLEPVMKEVLWGGTRLRDDYHYAIPSEHTGECWAVSAHDHGDCLVACGAYQGQTLSRLWKEHRELFGDMEGERFPLLVKIIDAKQDLSIQVHPDDEYAKQKENGSFGKMECWYILDCDQDASIVIGHHAKNKEEVAQMIHEGRFEAFIRTIPIKKGDFFQINPGTVHAIKGGTLILETQQNSDITYRVYDYGRLTNGKPRELHIEKSIDVIQAPFEESAAVTKREIKQGQAMDREMLVTCKYYTVEKQDVHGNITMPQDKRFLIYSVIDGKGMIDGVTIKKGTHFILPTGYGDFTLEGTMSLICSYC